MVGRVLACAVVAACMLMLGCAGAEQPQVESSSPARSPAAPAVTVEPRRGPAPHRVLSIGDSLAAAMQPYLERALPGWRLETDARNGRLLAEGMHVLSGRGTFATPVVLAFSLFTNDVPSNVDALERAVRESVRAAGRSGCAVWATIARPPFSDVPYDEVNARLEALGRELSGRLFIVPWAAAVAARPDWLGPDHIHATDEGYRGRARLYAEAALACA